MMLHTQLTSKFFFEKMCVQDAATDNQSIYSLDKHFLNFYYVRHYSMCKTIAVNKTDINLFMEFIFWEMSR